MIIGVLLALMSWAYFSTSSGFIKGINTYFWSTGEGAVLASDLRSYETSGSGTVSYSVVVDGVNIEGSTNVFKRWFGNTQSKFDTWAAQYEPGSSVTIYYNGYGDTSLGHWPTSYSYQFGLQGVSTLIMSLIFVRRGVKQIKTARAKLLPAE